LQNNLATMGIHWGDLYGEEFAAMVRQETLQWAQRLKNIGFKQQWLKNTEES
jgi:hypothetical protein